MAFEQHKNISKILDKKGRVDITDIDMHWYHLNRSSRVRSREDLIKEAKRFLENKFKTKPVDDKKRLAKSTFKVLGE